jgi:hypothetical protein
MRILCAAVETGEKLQDVTVLNAAIYNQFVGDRNFSLTNCGIRDDSDQRLSRTACTPRSVL